MSSKQGEYNYSCEEKQNHISVTEMRCRKTTKPAADLENEYEHCGRAHINADTMMMRCYSYVHITAFITHTGLFSTARPSRTNYRNCIVLVQISCFNSYFIITINKNHS